MLPSEYTSAESLEDAAAVAAALGCRLDSLAIEPARAAVMATLAPLFEGRGGRACGRDRGERAVAAARADADGARRTSSARCC
jgi:NH3-dependent NAD+ synthetase